MALTLEEINKIHSTKKAIPYKLYDGPNKSLYIGRLDGTLEQSFLIRGDVTGNSLKTTIANIGDYSKEEIIAIFDSIENLATKEELREAIKDLKCYSVAMSIIL